jgi:hypothetical protein
MNLVPRIKDNYTVVKLTPNAWYRLVGEKGEGYGVFKDYKLIYSNTDMYEASYFFDEATCGKV